MSTFIALLRGVNVGKGLCRYVTRPALATERLHERPDRPE